MEIRDDEISIDKPPSELDELILDVVDVLESARHLEDERPDLDAIESDLLDD